MWKADDGCWARSPKLGSRKWNSRPRKHQHRMKSLLATSLLAALAASLLAVSFISSMRPAGADPVVCATVYYRLMGGSRQDVVNNCYVPSTYSPQAGDGGCDITYYNGNGPSPTLQICSSYAVSHPMP